MSNDLSDDTTDMTRPARPARRPRPRSKAAGWDPRRCDACNLGNHGGCTGVACWECPRVNHPRLPGLAGTGDGPQGGTR